MTMTLMEMVMISRLARSSILLTRHFFDCDHGDDGAGGGDADDDGGEDLTSGQVVQLVDQRLLLDGDHWTLLQIASQPVNFITRTDLQVR